MSGRLLQATGLQKDKFRVTRVERSILTTAVALCQFARRRHVHQVDTRKLFSCCNTDLEPYRTQDLRVSEDCVLYHTESRHDQNLLLL